MSELYHNGSVVFDCQLTDSESADILKIFSDRPDPDDCFFGTFQPSVSVPPCSCLDFCDYVTGRSGMEPELKALIAYCSDHGVGIDSRNTLIEYIGDEDGGLRIVNGEIQWLDRDSVGVMNALTDELLAELRARDALPPPLEAVPTDDLLRELSARNVCAEQFPGEKNAEIYVVTSYRGYENDEWYYGPETVFLTAEEAHSYVLNEIAEAKKEFGTDAEPVIEYSDGEGEFSLDWPGHFLSWLIDRFWLKAAGGREG